MSALSEAVITARRDLERADAWPRPNVPTEASEHLDMVSTSLKKLLAALSTPPADDVCEALVREYLNEHGHHADAEHGFRAGLNVRPHGTVTDAERDRATEAVRTVLTGQEALHCTRVWEAWQHGTMSEDDFSQVADDDDAVAEIVSAALGLVSPQPYAAPEIPMFAGMLNALDALTIRPKVSLRGTVTDAEVEAAAEAICWAAEAESLLDVRMDMRAQYMREARAALEAARGVHP